MAVPLSPLPASTEEFLATNALATLTTCRPDRSQIVASPVSASTNGSATAGRVIPPADPRDALIRGQAERIAALEAAASAICERLIGTLRREALDQLLIVNESHLRQVLTEYLTHYNTARSHRSLGQVTPPKSAPVHQNRSTSPSTRSTASRSSADSPAGTTSQPYHPATLREIQVTS